MTCNVGIASALSADSDRAESADRRIVRAFYEKSVHAPASVTYAKIAAKSSSGVVMGCRSNISTSTFSTSFEKNAGRLGPM